MLSFTSQICASASCRDRSPASVTTGKAAAVSPRRSMAIPNNRIAGWANGLATRARLVSVSTSARSCSTLASVSRFAANAMRASGESSRQATALSGSAAMREAEMVSRMICQAAQPTRTRRTKTGDNPETTFGDSLALMNTRVHPKASRQLWSQRRRPCSFDRHRGRARPPIGSPEAVGQSTAHSNRRGWRSLLRWQR